jgi:hypothetical protein
MAQTQNIGRWLARFDAPDAPCLLVAFVVALCLFGLLHRTWQPADFVIAGSAVVDGHKLPTEVPYPLANGTGYDGQFYFRLALNPFTHTQTDYGIKLDTPARRQQRILYPLLAWLLSFATPYFVPAVLIALNALALCLLGWLGGVYFQARGRHALWGALFALYPGFLLTLRADVPEALEVALLLTSLLLVQRGRHAAATIALVLAVLTKETALLAALAAALVYLMQVRKGQTRTLKWFYFAAPLVVFIIWQVTLFRVWGELPVWAGRVEYGVPFGGIVRALGAVLRTETPGRLRTLVALPALCGFILLGASQLRTTSANAHEKLAWLLYAGHALVLNDYTWNVDWNYLRALSEFYALGVLIIVCGRGRLRAALLACGVTLLWCLQAYRVLSRSF